MADKFKWLSSPTMTRSRGGSGGGMLETGHIYDVAAFSAAIVGEWILTGHAEAVTVKANDTALDVKSPVVKIKPPKFGAEL